MPAVRRIWLQSSMTSLQRKNSYQRPGQRSTDPGLPGSVQDLADLLGQSGNGEGLLQEGDAGLETFFDWVNNANPDSWVRLSTFGGAIRPNPSLHTEGKVRFKI